MAGSRSSTALARKAPKACTEVSSAWSCSRVTATSALNTARVPGVSEKCRSLDRAPAEGPPPLAGKGCTIDAVAGFRDADLTITDPDGRLHWYTSSPGARRGGCSQCGTPLLFASQRWPGEMHIARALLDDALDRAPSVHVFYDAHVPWLELGDDLPREP